MLLKTLTTIVGPSKRKPKLHLSNFLKKKSLEIIQKKEFSLSSVVLKEKSDQESEASSEESKLPYIEPITKRTKSPYVVDEKDKELVEELKKGNLLYPYKDPIERTVKILFNDLKVGGKKAIHAATNFDVGKTEVEFFLRETDILIVGGGPAGLMTAYEIKSKFPNGPKVMVVDRDPQSPFTSTNLGRGQIVQQLANEEEEFEMSRYGIEFMSRFHRLTPLEEISSFDLGFEPMGSLVLADESNAEKLILKSDTLTKYNVRHKILNSENLKRKFPWLNLDGVVFGCLGLMNDGFIDPWAFLKGIKTKAVNLGVHFTTAEVIDMAEEDSDPTRVICRLPDGSYNWINFGICIFTAGIDNLDLIEKINQTEISPFNVKLPIEQRRRYEYCFKNVDGPGLDTPIIIDPDGTYFRREGLNGFYVAGVPSVPGNDKEENDIYNTLNTKVKPFLMRRIPNFEKYELVNGWADTYEYNSANEVGITGHHPGDYRINYACGFNHLGLQLIPGVGKALMEYIMYQRYRTFDLTLYHIDNLYHRQHLEADKKRKEQLEAGQRMALPK